MNRPPVLRTLRDHAEELIARFDVASLAVFGSAARDQLQENSDVDVLVRFRGPAHVDRYFDLKFHLEELLGRPVDLATENMIRPRLRQRIENELEHVA